VPLDCAPYRIGSRPTAGMKSAVKQPIFDGTVRGLRWLKMAENGCIVHGYTSTYIVLCDFVMIIKGLCQLLNEKASTAA
jgi:hypothetical protein